LCALKTSQQLHLGCVVEVTCTDLEVLASFCREIRMKFPLKPEWEVDLGAVTVMVVLSKLVNEVDLQLARVVYKGSHEAVGLSLLVFAVVGEIAEVGKNTGRMGLKSVLFDAAVLGLAEQEVDAVSEAVVSGLTEQGVNTVGAY
jgi:hypothetical protein